MKMITSYIAIVVVVCLNMGCSTSTPMPPNPKEEAAPASRSPASLDMKKAEVEVEAHYGKAHPEIKEYVLWTARTFGPGGMWLNEDAFAALPDDAREKRIQYMVTLLEEGEYGRHLCKGLAETSALKDKRLVPGLMKVAGYHRENGDYDCRPKWMAVAALARQESDDAVPLLISLVDHGNQNTRNWARAALSRKLGQDFKQDKQAWAKWWQAQGNEPIDGKLLEPSVVSPQNKGRAAELRKRFEARVKIDRTIYSQEERHEIESLYQEANKQRNSVEKRQCLETLIDEFPEANRAGCAALYLGQMNKGQDREAYLRLAINEYSDCWYGDGVQVGAYARFYLAWDYLHAGKTTEAERLFEELRKGFPDAIDHQGLLLFDRIPKPANANELPDASKATAQAITVPTKYVPSYGGGIRGTVRDGTPDYSERQFRHLERVVAQAIAEKGRDEAGRDESIMKALMELIGPRGPMSSVTVTLSSKSTTPEAREFLLKTVTDSKGNFSFPDVREGEYVVTAEIRRGWLAGRTEVERQIKHYRTFDSMDLVFHPNLVVVKGKITDTSGRPLASVKVTATQSCGNDYGGGMVQSHVVSGVSDRDGSYELRGLLPGNAYSWAEEYKIRAEFEGYVTAEMKILIMNEDVRAAAERLGRILLQLSEPEAQTRLAEWKAKLPACRGNTITGINLMLGSSSLLSGKVTDPQKKPQPACYVWLVPVKDIPAPIATNALLPKPVLTDAQGAFEFCGVPAGSYTFQIGKDHRSVNVEAARVTVQEGEATTGLQLKFDVQPMGRIEATVCELVTEKPIADFAASVWQVVNPREYYSATGQLNMNAAGPGTFSVENISPGKAELEITAPGYAPEHLHIDVPPGQTAPLCVRMAKAGVARIRVTQDGAQIEPMENFQAFSKDTGSVTYGRRASKDAGWYEIPGLKAGRYTIRGHVSNGQRSIRYETASVVIEADKTSDVTLDFGGNSGLVITLAFPSGLWAQAWVEASDAPAGQPMEKNLDMCAYLWADWPGDYNAKHLRPGTYRICARLVDPTKDKAKKSKLPPEQSQTVTLKDGTTSAVQFRF